MKDGMSGMLQQVRLGQVRKARKSWIIRPPLLSMSIFQNSEKNRQIRGHPGDVRWWKNGLRGLFKQVRLGQVRKPIKSWKSEALGPPIHSLTCFGRKFERTVFERTTSSRIFHFCSALKRISSHTNDKMYYSKNNLFIQTSILERCCYFQMQSEGMGETPSITLVHKRFWKTKKAEFLKPDFDSKGNYLFANKFSAYLVFNICRFRHWKTDYYLHKIKNN
jgi:hypothetical protein